MKSTLYVVEILYHNYEFVTCYVTMIHHGNIEISTCRFIEDETKAMKLLSLTAELSKGEVKHERNSFNEHVTKLKAEYYKVR